MPETRYVVIRPAPDLPLGFMPPDWDGRWIERHMPIAAPYDIPTGAAYSTGRYETRDDGERAEVYEVRA